MNVTGSVARSASTAAGEINPVGVSVLRKQLDLAQNQNSQLIASVPQAPRPGGTHFDQYA